MWLTCVPTDDLTPYIRASASGFLETDIRVNPQGDQFLFALEAVLQPPPLPTGGGDLQVHPSCIAQLARLLARLGISNRGVCERHGFVSLVGRYFSAPLWLKGMAVFWG